MFAKDFKSALKYATGFGFWSKLMLFPEKMVVTYNDTWLKIFGSLTIAHFIEMIGQEDTVWELLLLRSYYIEVGSGFIIAFTVWEYVSIVIRWLDRKHDWTIKPVSRTLHQLALGIVIPSLLTYLLVSIQFRFLFQEDISTGDWLLYEFPMTVVFILLINVFYTGYYFFERWRYSELLLKSQVEHSGTHDVTAVKDTASKSGAPASQKIALLARKGAKVFPVESEQIGYIVKDGAFNYIKTFSDETYIIDKTLDELQQLLGDGFFFRANRQTIINLKSLQSYMPIENGKLKLNLKLSSLPTVIVSQKRAPDFRVWIKARHTSSY